MLRRIKKKEEAVKRKISKERSKLNLRKKQILGRKNISLSEKKQIIVSETDLFRQKVINYRLTFAEEKHVLLHPSPYKGFIFTKTLTGLKKNVAGKEKFLPFHDTYQRIYKAVPGYKIEDLDRTVPKILKNSNVQGVLVVFEIYNAEQDTTDYVSNYMRKLEYELAQENEQTVYEWCIEHFSAYGSFTLKFIYLRVIYKKRK